MPRNQDLTDVRSDAKKTNRDQQTTRPARHPALPEKVEQPQSSCPSRRDRRS